MTPRNNTLTFGETKHSLVVCKAGGFINLEYSFKTDAEDFSYKLIHGEVVIKDGIQTNTFEADVRDMPADEVDYIYGCVVDFIATYFHTDWFNGYHTAIMDFLLMACEDASEEFIEELKK